MPGTRALKTSRTVRHLCTAEWAYEQGFVTGLRRREAGGVRLYDMELIEDDGPGAGASGKGCYEEPLTADLQVRKTLVIRDTRARSAKVVFYITEEKDNTAALMIELNGHALRLPSLTEAHPDQRRRAAWQYLDVPVRWLRRGQNHVVIRSEDNAPAAAWTLYIARADEYADGGGADRDPGKRSRRSTNAGRTWSKRLGKTGDVIGEYLVRINLERYVREGGLTSPPLDLWSDDADEMIKCPADVQSVSLSLSGNAPAGTSITWQARTGTSADPIGRGWTAWRTVSRRPRAAVNVPGGFRRYLQWRAVLNTSNPLRSPTVRRVAVRAKIEHPIAASANVYVVDQHNKQIEHSSLPFEYEDPAHPSLRKLRRTYGLDDIVDGARTDFEEMVRLRHWVATQWTKGSPLRAGPYPAWDAVEILRRAHGRHKCGGMCMQFAIVMIQLLAARGIHARHVNKISHEVVEAWSDAYGKWVFMDPTSYCNFHQYDIRTGEPLNLIEMLDAFVAKYVDGPVDWRCSSEQFAARARRGQVQDQPIGVAATNPDTKAHTPHHLGYDNAAFLRMMPRNNYYAKPTPRPLAHGSMQWPWTGYVNWEDARLGRHAQHAWYTDRRRDFYPTLNQVQYDVAYGRRPSRLDVRMITFTPAFDTFLVNVDDRGWTPSGARFAWSLRAGLNRLEMRSRSRWGREGAISHLTVTYQPSV